MVALYTGHHVDIPTAMHLYDMPYHLGKAVFIIHGNIHAALCIALHGNDRNAFFGSKLFKGIYKIVVLDKFELNYDRFQVKKISHLNKLHLTVVSVLITKSGLRKTKDDHQIAVFSAFFLHGMDKVAVLFFIDHSAHKGDQLFRSAHIICYLLCDLFHVVHSIRLLLCT